jgi:outer membrane immunogenic protein
MLPAQGNGPEILALSCRRAQTVMLKPANAETLLALAVGAAVLAFVTPSAAEGFLDSPQEAQWTGFYAGGQLGGAWSDASWDYKNSNWFNTLGPEVVISNFAIDAGGFVGGGQTGFNFQSGAWVFGVEGSVAGTDLDGRIRSPYLLAVSRLGVFPRLSVSWLEAVCDSDDICSIIPRQRSTQRFPSDLI